MQLPRRKTETLKYVVSTGRKCEYLLKNNTISLGGGILNVSKVLELDDTATLKIDCLKLTPNEI